MSDTLEITRNVQSLAYAVALRWLALDSQHIIVPYQHGFFESRSFGAERSKAVINHGHCGRNESSMPLSALSHLLKPCSVLMHECSEIGTNGGVLQELYPMHEGESSSSSVTDSVEEITKILCTRPPAR